MFKHRDEGGVSAPAETVRREPDEPKEMSMIRAIAEDIMHAIKGGSIEHLEAALEALVEHVQSEDQTQDEETMGAEQ